MQVLITGASGRLGKLLRTAWLSDCATDLDAVWSSRRGADQGEVAWDILTGPMPVLEKGFVVLHLAGVLSGDSVALSANAAMAHIVCASAKAAKAKHVFLASSAAVYGSATCDHAESHSTRPLSKYGFSKRAMELAALRSADQQGQHPLGITCLRIGNVLGADGLLGRMNLRRHVTLDHVRGHDGGPVRSFVGPHGFARIVAGLLQRVRVGQMVPDMINIAAPGAVAMAELLQEADIRFNLGPLNPNVIPKVSLSTTRLARLVPVRQTSARDLITDWREWMEATA